jgi:UDP-N-acetylglucosamine acyltransferase
MAQIHPSAVIEGDVTLADDVVVGPFCYIQGKVSIGKGTVVEGHVNLGFKHGELIIGENNHFSPGAAIGGPPQDIGYKNERTRLRIGNNNTFREFCTANLATTKGDLETTIGSHCYLMAYTHVGHDCKISDYCIIANNSHLGGHTVLEDHVVIGGVCAFNQFTNIGRFSFIGGGSVVNKDVLPFCRAHGDHAVCRATNKVGLSRNGFSKEEVENVHRALRIMIMGSTTIEEGLERIARECTPSENIAHLTQFVRNSKRGIAR